MKSVEKKHMVRSLGFKLDKLQKWKIKIKVQIGPLEHPYPKLPSNLNFFFHNGHVASSNWCLGVVVAWAFSKNEEETLTSSFKKKHSLNLTIETGLKKNLDPILVFKWVYNLP